MSNDAERKARLAQALRDNLRRRKVQARAISAGDGPEAQAAAEPDAPPEQGA